ncbi:hypothetical protein J6S88_01335, partial [bacterium]|nr:hypothetical protein [bacterium]
MKKLKEFVKELKECMNSRLISVYVFGAKANSGDSDMHKHVDTLLIIEDFKNEDWPLLYNILNRWKKLGNPCPIIMTFQSRRGAPGHRGPLARGRQRRSGQTRLGLQAHA